MALIICSECRGEVSEHAVACPHCGNPINSTPVIIEQKTEIHKSYKVRNLIALLALILLVGGYFYIKYQASIYSGPGTFFGNLNQNLDSGNFNQVLKDLSPQQPTSGSDKSKHITLQKVTNVGYSFYIGQIDYSNAPAISDDWKNQITQIIHNANFPKKLLDSLAIVIVNTLAATPGQYITAEGGNIPVFNFDPQFLSGGGIYSSYSGQTSVIFIDKNLFGKGQSENDFVNAIEAEQKKVRLIDVLTHKLAHHIGARLTENEWERFYELRGIPKDTSRRGQEWNLSPNEDFAEVYKNIFTGFDVKTYYGLLLPGFDGIFEHTCREIYQRVYDSYITSYQKSNPPTDCSKVDSYMKLFCNPSQPSPVTSAQVEQAEDNADTDDEVQSCRREVLSNQAKYPNDWQYGVPYKSTVGPKTKEFINNVITRLNQ